MFSPLLDFPTLPENVRIGSKQLAVTNTLAYEGMEFIMP